MNIFVLAENPELAAAYQCDKHVVKMVLETAQILCSGFPQEAAPYRRTHYNHPCCVWARESTQNFEWLCSHGIALGKQYSKRYAKVHKSLKVINWAKDNKVKLKFSTKWLTPFAQALPEKFKEANAVSAYRAYYLEDKAYFAKWEKGVSPPEWWNYGRR